MKEVGDLKLLSVQKYLIVASFSVVLCELLSLFHTPFFPKREGRKSEEEETRLQMMNPPLDCILSIRVHPVGQSQVLESS